MINKTRDYDQFKFREDNRATINQGHVKRLAESIRSNNLLEYTPIIVNGEMEVLDGQHRLLAAKELGVDVYYKLEQQLKPSDMIALNLSQKWGQQDYMNYYCKNHYPEYLKLQQYMKTNNISLRVATHIVIGSSHDATQKFRNGEYVHSEEALSGDIDICWETIDYIRRMNGNSPYTSSAKFWAALLIMVRHASFNPTKWRDNIKRMVERFTGKVSKEAYLELFMDVHNWRNSEKIDLKEE